MGLHRNTPLTRKKKLTRKVPLRRAGPDQAYNDLRDAYLAAHPDCGACALFGYPEVEKSTEVHHTQGRGIHKKDEKTLLAVCRRCHQRIDAEPALARRLGLIGTGATGPIN